MRTIIRDSRKRTVFLVYIVCLVPIAALLYWYISLLVVRSTPSLPPEVAAQTAATLWNSPLPKPAFLTALSASSSDTGLVNQICAGLKITAIWEPGDFGEDTYRRVVGTTQLEIDAFLIPSYDLSFGEEAISLLRKDSAGKIVGSHGGDISTCFNVQRLADGLHLAVLRFQTRSGKTLEHRWAFKTETQNGRLTINLP